MVATGGAILESDIVLVTGGAGYIGAHVSLFLTQKNYRVVILDDYSQQQIFSPAWPLAIIKGDYADANLLHQIFSTYRITAIFHLAGFTEVGRSVAQPISFYDNNVAKTVKLLAIALAHNVKKIIFASSCAVYGQPQFLPLSEDHPCQPVSPYGWSKLMIERILQDCALADGLNYVILRFFNAVGACAEYGLSEQHQPETHLVPLLGRALQSGAKFYVFGNDYATPDGTCIRDYVHVWDLAGAHWLALEHLKQQPENLILNLGAGRGYSVLEIITQLETQAQRRLHYEFAPRRPGDPAILLADISRAQRILGWTPKLIRLFGAEVI